MSIRFHQIEIGQRFRFLGSSTILTKKDKRLAVREDGTFRSFIDWRKAVILVEDEVSWRDLDKHTFEFTPAQLAGVIEQIVERVLRDYSDKNFDTDRLTKGLYCAHRAKPIRLIALLNSCALDFPTDVIMGVYRHYDPDTDTMRDGWTAQHAEPHVPSVWDILFGD